MILTKEFLHTLYEYESGYLISKQKRGPATIGKKIVTKHKDGYISTTINRKRFYVHRLIYMMFHGELPRFIDHIDGNRANNKIQNLRPATESQNNVNSKGRSKSGYKNIYFDPRKNHYLVVLIINRKKNFFGCFKDLELACLVAEEARNKYHGEFANHGYKGTKKII